MKLNVYLKIAAEVAQVSKDQSTKVGAVIVRDDLIISTGHNGFPRGINDNDQTRQERPKKYFYMAHAEVNAICNAARTGVSTKDTNIYVTMFPCHNCAIAIIQAGIKSITVPALELRQDMRESYNASIEMLTEAGVTVYCRDKYISEAELRYLIKK